MDEVKMKYNVNVWNNDTRSSSWVTVESQCDKMAGGIVRRALVEKYGIPEFMRKFVVCEVAEHREAA
jgi:hypothetical protein